MPRDTVPSFWGRASHPLLWKAVQARVAELGAGAHHGRGVQAAGGGSRRGHGCRLGLGVRGIRGLLSLQKGREDGVVQGARGTGGPSLHTLCPPQTPGGAPPSTPDEVRPQVLPVPRSPSSPSPRPPTATGPEPAAAPPPPAGPSRLSWGAAGDTQGWVSWARGDVPGERRVRAGPVPGIAATGDWSGTRGAAPSWRGLCLQLSWRNRTLQGTEHRTPDPPPRFSRMPPGTSLQCPRRVAMEVPWPHAREETNPQTSCRLQA